MVNEQAQQETASQPQRIPAVQKPAHPPAKKNILHEHSPVHGSAIIPIENRHLTPQNFLN
jgi:hypothetical protein